MSQFRRFQNGRGSGLSREEVDSVAQVFRSGLAAAINSNPDIPAKYPTPEQIVHKNPGGSYYVKSYPLRRHSIRDWWARVRTDLGWLPFYNVDWGKLTEAAFDLAPLDAASGWEDVEEYGRKMALLKETIDVGDLYPPSA